MPKIFNMVLGITHQKVSLEKIISDSKKLKLSGDSQCMVTENRYKVSKLPLNVQKLLTQGDCTEKGISVVLVESLRIA